MDEPEEPSVLLVAEQLRRRVPGGIGTHARGLLQGLRQLGDAGEGVDVTILASRAPRRGGGDELEGMGWPLRTSRLPGRALTRAWDHRWLHAPSGFRVVHSVSMAAPLPEHAGRSRLVVTVHDLAWRRHPDATTSRGARWHEAALARARRAGADVVVPSRYVAADVVAAGIEEARVTVAQSGADHLPSPDATGAAVLLERIGVTGEFLLTVGTLEPRKNLGRLARAHRAVRASLPEPWPLVVVGPSGWGERDDMPPPSEDVRFTGPVPSAVLAGLYQRARAFAYVPLSEGAGLPPLEALWMGTPTVVSTEVPSVYDLGASGPPPALRVDPLEVDEIAQGLVTVLTDDDTRADLSARGSHYAHERTWQRVARTHLTLWRSLR